jgi:hypothetical protein
VAAQLQQRFPTIERGQIGLPEVGVRRQQRLKRLRRQLPPLLRIVAGRHRVLIFGLVSPGRGDRPDHRQRHNERDPSFRETQ